jgi:chorismate dehydratase
MNWKVSAAGAEAIGGAESGTACCAQAPVATARDAKKTIHRMASIIRGGGLALSSGGKIQETGRVLQSHLQELARARRPALQPVRRPALQMQAVSLLCLAELTNAFLHAHFAVIPNVWIGSLRNVNQQQDTRLRIAAIDFLNPAPLMWDFEHPPLCDELAKRYRIDRMTPSECAAKLATGQADIGLIPIAALATSPELRILPGCTIASKGRVRSLLLVHRAWQPLTDLQSVAADTSSRTTVAYARILFHKWGNPGIEFLPMAADLDLMLGRTDAAILIGDPALLALEERFNRMERTGEELVYRDLAAEWNVLTGLPFVSAVWGAARGSLLGIACSRLLDEGVAQDFIRSRDHGLANIDALVAEWSKRFPIPEETIREYLTTNIHYVLDEECVEGMRGFFRMAAECGVLPPYDVTVDELARR